MTGTYDARLNGICSIYKPNDQRLEKNKTKEKKRRKEIVLCHPIINRMIIFSSDLHGLSKNLST